MLGSSFVSLSLRQDRLTLIYRDVEEADLSVRLPTGPERRPCGDGRRDGGRESSHDAHDYLDGHVFPSCQGRVASMSPAPCSRLPQVYEDPRDGH